MNKLKYLSIALLILSTACLVTFPTAAPVIDESQLQTQVAQTVMARLTIQAGEAAIATLTEIARATATPLRSDTPPPTWTPTVTLPPPTATPEPPTAKILPPTAPPPPTNTPAPLVRTVTSVAAAFLNTPPKLDGYFGEWKLDCYSVNKVVFGSNKWDNKDDLSARVMVGWTVASTVGPGSGVAVPVGRGVTSGGFDML